MAPTSRSPFAAPGKPGRGLWRAFAEVTCGGLLTVISQTALDVGDSPGSAQLVFCAVLLALFAVRRRYPVISLLGVSAFLGLLPAAGLPAAVTAYTTARQLAVPRRRAAVLLASTVLTVLTCAVFAPSLGLGGHGVGFALGSVLAATTLIVPGLVGASGGQQERLLGALHDRAAAAEAARKLVDSESRIHERSRIAAEMHDLVGHRLSLISLHSGGLEMALEKESPELRDEAALVRRATGDAMRELREVLGVLGPFGRDTGSDALMDTTGTRPDVETLAEESRSGGIPVGLTWNGPDLTDRAAQVRRAVHRVVRESLTNVHRYAAGAHVTVMITHTDDRVEVLVRNGLPPVAPAAVTGLGSGRGLVGLRERVTLLGGTLEAAPTPGGGFAVTARIPARPDPGASLASAGARPLESASAAPPEPPSGSRPEHAPGRVQHRAVSALTGLLGLGGVGVMMAFGLVLVAQAQPQSDGTEPEEPRIGMSQTEVEEAVYGDDPAVRAAATGREPARPKSATKCVFPPVPFDDFAPLAESPNPELEPDPEPTTRTESTASESAPPESTAPEEESTAGHLMVARYCFRGGKLAAIDRFTVPVASNTPPWESP